MTHYSRQGGPISSAGLQFRGAQIPDGSVRFPVFLHNVNLNICCQLSTVLRPCPAPIGIVSWATPPTLWKTGIIARTHNNVDTGKIKVTL
jgi:hypothetical protein